VSIAVLVSSFLLAVSPTSGASPASPAASPVPAAVAPTPAPTPTPHTYWIQPLPVDADERALQAALVATAGKSNDAVVKALVATSDAHPGTAASGLARLAAGLLLLDAGQPAEAVAHLRHADVALTAVADYGALALARSLEAKDARAAADAYQSLLQSFPETPLVCAALLGGADSYEKAGLPAKALPLVERALGSCAGAEPRALAIAARCHERQQQWAEAAARYDRIDHDFPLSEEAQQAAIKLRALARNLPASEAGVRAARDLKKALLLFDANRPALAAPLFRRLLLQRAPADQLDLVRVRLGRSLLEQKHWREAEVQLKAVPATSAMAPEAAFFLAKTLVQHGRSEPSAYQDVATRYPNTPWAEEALVALAMSHLKDFDLAGALPYFRQVLHDYPEGAFAERATWWVGLAEIHEGHHEAAAAMMEAAARRATSASTLTPAFLFWAGQARLDAGDTARGRALLEETVRRYKYAYHGRRALAALGKLPPSEAVSPPTMRASHPDPSAEIAPARLARVRQLLLIERLDEAQEELKLQPATSVSQATIAWIHSRRGRLRPAITAMKRAYPEYIGESADQLPLDVLQIIYPLQFRHELETKAQENKLDPALVAALICQESTFDPGARSAVGAHGLMQIMPKTGRVLARTLGVRFRTQSLHNPEVSLGFGTRYLRDMIDRYDGRVERALAAYNAGPHRVEAWTATRPNVSAEEFTETIPFTETRGYVMSILSMTERYRQIYGMGPAPVAAKE
jgi:soluble lytic murein transglycosylase